MSVFKSVSGPIDRVLEDLFADPELAEDVVYKRYDSQSFSSSLGHTVPETTDFSVKAIRLKHDENSAAAALSEVQKGDVVFMFKGSVFPADHSLKDKVVDGEGRVYSIKGIDDIFGFAFSVTVHG